jgi:exonuclease VII large subunit
MQNASIVMTGAAALVLLACAGPAQEVRKAEQEQAEAVADYKSQRAELDRELSAEWSEQQKTIDEARAELNRERKEFTAEARERLSKIEARADQLQYQTTSAVGQPRYDWTAYKQMKTDVEQRINQLDQVPATAWKQSKEAVEQSLDSLEDNLDDLEGNL